MKGLTFVFTQISNAEFIRVANIKGDIAHIINQACKKSVAEVSKLNGAWLVKEENIYRILFLIRFLKKDERVHLYESLHYIFESDDEGIIRCNHTKDDTKEMQIEVIIKER